MGRERKMAYLVAVDSGHGLETAGKRTPGLKADIKVGGQVVRRKGEQIKEKEWNRAAADALITALKRCGLSVVDVSPGTKDVPIADRIKAANAAGADLLISKHFNAAGGKWWEPGYSVAFVYEGAGTETREFAQCVQDEIAKVVPWRSDGVAGERDFMGHTLAILRQTAMPAVLTETGFMDVWESAQKMLDPGFVAAEAEACCRGICRYLGVRYKAPAASGGGEGNKAPSSGQEPSGDAAPAYTRLLKLISPNMQGDDVEAVQRALIATGADIAADGIFGPATERAVRRYQNAKGGLAVDGQVGPQTWAALLGGKASGGTGNGSGNKTENGNAAGSEGTAGAGSGAKVTLSRLLKLTSPNMRGEDVRGVQGLLRATGAKIEVDGIFGPNTERAVKRYQNAKGGLAVDGIVGRDTITALGGAWKG